MKGGTREKKTISAVMYILVLIDLPFVVWCHLSWNEQQSTSEEQCLALYIKQIT